MFHIFSCAFVGFINILKHQCMAMKYLKLYSTFPFPFSGCMLSPLCLKCEPLLCCNANRPEYNSATVAACVCYMACRRKERQGNVNCGYSSPTVTTLCVLNLLKPSGYYIYTTRFNTHKLYVLPTHCIYVFCVDVRTNSDYFTILH
jgi:hypothetical protein